MAPWRPTRPRAPQRRAANTGGRQWGSDGLEHRRCRQRAPVGHGLSGVMFVSLLCRWCLWPRGTRVFSMVPKSSTVKNSTFWGSHGFLDTGPSGSPSGRATPGRTVTFVKSVAAVGGNAVSQIVGHTSSISVEFPFENSDSRASHPLVNTLPLCKNLVCSSK